MNNKNNDTLESLIPRKELEYWGTTLDKIDKTPPQYVAKSFLHMDHDDVINFGKLSNKEKFEQAFWAETQTSKKVARQSFVMGIVVAVFVIITMLSLLPSF